MCRNAGGITAVLRAMKYGKKDAILPKFDESTFTNEDALGQFDFKQVLQNYYLHIVHKNKIERSFDILANYKPIGLRDLTTVEIIPHSVWTSTSQYWNNHNEDITKHKKYSRDYFYVVDLRGDPSSAQDIVTMPSKIGGRLIYYKKNKGAFMSHSADLLGSRTEMDFHADLASLEREIAELQANTHEIV